MICKECGTKFSSGLFCPECGTRVGSIWGLGKDEQTNGQCAGEEYDAKKYGAQGLLEEQVISKEIQIAAGERRVFENKRLILEERISVGENAKVEFRNCSLVINKSRLEAIRPNGADISFEHCTIDGKDGFLCKHSCISTEKGETLEFRNCMFMDSGNSDSKDDFFIKLIDHNIHSVYFENCLIKRACLCWATRENKVEFRNCILDIGINRNPLFKDDDVFVKGDSLIVEFNNCDIKSFQRLHNGAKLIIRNSYFDYYN